ncbi:consortin, connexin sorting protein b isoform X1 [Oryzias melastigma]|uniref:Consortin, connexin sorting protein b n=1 Tax=Oryzias melastigma TaxID=30732 RepID=A0A3B3C8C9_ORYME|nr:consortin, connexin sorting protein b isoform X1 [Oryzias melastigma]
MGNKTSSSLKEEEEVFIDSITGGAPTDGPQGPSPKLLASLQSLGENSDYTVLPHSLHQIAEAYSLKGDYQLAIQFLQLERLYHERLLTNLTALQENWESRWGEQEADICLGRDGISQTNMDVLRDICRTHHRPSVRVDQNKINATINDNHTKSTEPQPHQNEVHDHRRDEEQEQSRSTEPEQAAQWEEDRGDGAYEEGREVEEEQVEEQCEETPEEEEVKVEWPTGVPQASEKELAKLSHKEGTSPDGLVSILKRRRASLDGLPPPSDTTSLKQNSKRKVRFSEPEDGMDQDDVGGNSCLVLLLLCLVTVVISIGGTALYCTLVGTYSNICTDFTHNVDFYASNVQQFFEGVRRWLPLWTG